MQQHLYIETKCITNKMHARLSNQGFNYQLQGIPGCFMWHRLHKYSLFPCYMQEHNNDSNFVVRTLAKKAAVILQQVSASTEERESKRAMPAHTVLQWDNYRSCLGVRRHTFTSVRVQEVRTKPPPHPGWVLLVLNQTRKTQQQYYKL